MFAWHPGLLRPYESMWALAHRFCILNAPTPRDFVDLIGAKTYPMYKPFYQRASLDDASWFDDKGFSRVLGITWHSHWRLFPMYYRLDPFSSPIDVLQYCPECLKLSFHSPIYQTMSLRLCPIHRIRLSWRCPRCEKPLTYKMTSESINNPGRCLKCDFELISVTNLTALMSSRLPYEAIKRLAKITSVARHVANDPRIKHWSFDKELTGQPPEEAYRMFMEYVGVDTNITELFFSASSQRMETYSINIRKKHPKPRYPYKIHKYNVRTLPLSLYVGTQPFWVSHLYPIYENMKRTLKRAIVKDHERCVHVMSIVPKYTSMHKAAEACVIALAFERWKYYWQSLDVGHVYNIRNKGYLYAYCKILEKINTNEYIDSKSSIRSSGDTLYKGSLEEYIWAFKRMFYITLLETFRNAIDLSNLERDEKIDPLHHGWPGIGAWSYPRFFIGKSSTTPHIELIWTPGEFDIDTIKTLIASSSIHNKLSTKILDEMMMQFMEGNKADLNRHTVVNIVQEYNRRIWWDN